MPISLFHDSNNNDGGRVIFAVRNGLVQLIDTESSNEEQTWKTGDIFYFSKA